MLTNPSTGDRASRTALMMTTQKVVIVNGTTEILEGLQSMLDAGHYDVVFVESSQHAYSQIKRVQPDLVILCVRIDDPDGLQVLSMLKLDDATRDIPILTYTIETEEESDEDVTEPSEVDTFFVASKAAMRMN
jgi:two-component system, cell cycle response regulator DivK